MDARQLIDFAYDDNAKDFREGLYAAIYDKVSDHIEAKKQEVARTLVTQEGCGCPTKDDVKKTAEKEAEKEVDEHEKEKHGKKGEVAKHEKEMHKEETNLQEAVSRKDFQMVADLIKTHDDHGKRKELAQHHAEIFHRQNPRFDRAKFMKAANVQE